jgi:hypothetical protein
MKLRFYFILGLLVTALFVTAAWALNAYVDSHPTDANVKPSPSPSPTPFVAYVEFINGTSLTAGSAIHFGDVEPGTTYTSTLSVQNTGNTAFTVTLNVAGLPTGWTLTYSKNGFVVQPQTTATGNLVLVIPDNAATGVSTWTTTVTGTP